MKLKIGENIKLYRKTNDITQEELAAMLGISCQSISRWERGICYPDLELMPQIAEILGVSVDSLLGADARIESKEVDAYLERFQKAVSEGRIYDCVSVAREGIAKYPNNFALLNKLMYALFMLGDETGNIPEWKENMEKHDAEIVALGERIRKYCPDMEIRLEATCRLAFHHCEMNRKELGREIYETLPSQDWCRENQMWWALEEEEKLPFIRRKIRKSFGNLDDGMWRLATKGFLPDEEALIVFEKIWELVDMVYDDVRPRDTWGTANSYYWIAKFHARLGHQKEMLEQLRLAAEAAKIFDNRPEEYKTYSILLGERTKRRIDFETADTRPLCEIMRDTWLADPAFDSFRNTDEFKESIRLLNQ